MVPSSAGKWRQGARREPDVINTPQAETEAGTRVSLGADCACPDGLVTGL